MAMIRWRIAEGGLRNHVRKGRRGRCALLPVIGLAFCLPALAVVQDPFPVGFSMNTLGAIIDASGPTGRQPWIGAAFHADTTGCGAAFGAASYFGALAGPDLYRASLGAWYSGRLFVVKAAFSHFSALDVYFEETGFFSVGSRHLRFLSFSADVSGTRMRCAGFSTSPAVAEAGISALVPWSWAAIS
ncbi:MAG: hypothetical protein JW699_06945, partial [Chitinispirillaceae bacterium]|nr:hypothetical protein [Chitinispirillaceae bacterium]